MDSDSVNLGSNPSPPATSKPQETAEFSGRNSRNDENKPKPSTARKSAQRIMTLHERHVCALIERIPGAVQSGFGQRLKAEVSHPEGRTLGEIDRRGGLRIPRVTPDAFLIDHARKHIVVYEVEISNPISSDKAWLLEDLRLLLDEFDYTLLVITIDRYGVPRLHDSTTAEIWADIAMPYLVNSGVTP